jgi:hypothetical protein
LIDIIKKSFVCKNLTSKKNTFATLNLIHSLLKYLYDQSVEHVYLNFHINRHCQL